MSDTLSLDPRKDREKLLKTAGFMHAKTTGGLWSTSSDPREIGRVITHDPPGSWGLRHVAQAEDPHDAAFMAWAHENVPKLVAEVREQEAMVEEADGRYIQLLDNRDDCIRKMGTMVEALQYAARSGHAEWCEKGHGGAFCRCHVGKAIDALKKVGEAR